MRRARVCLCVCLVLAAATGASASPAPRPADVRRLLSEWRFDEAATLVDRLARDTESARQDEARGLVLFHQGKYPEALRALQRAQRSQLGCRRRGASKRAACERDAKRLRETIRLVKATADAVRGFVERTSAGGHFRFRVRKGKDELLVPFAGETLEQMRRRLRDDLGYAPRGPVLVEIYGAPADLARVSPLTVSDIERTGTVALCKYNRLMIITPRALPRGYAWRDTLAHEYSHLVVGRTSHNRAPVWLQEGLAKYLEVRWRASQDAPLHLSPAEQHLLAEALKGRRPLIRWSQMHPSMAKLPSQLATVQAFAQVQTAIAFVLQRSSDQSALRRLIAAVSQGKPAWASVALVTGLDRDRFQQAYRRYLRGLKLRRLPGLVPPRLRFGKRSSKEQQIAQIKIDRARRYFRLADMLRQRKLVRAAIVEYKKARHLVGDRDALVANALARTYIELGSPDQAINTLLPVLEYYPEVAGGQVTVGTAYLLNGNRAAATDHLQVALRINPFDPEIHCGLAKALAAGPAADLHARTCSELRR